jgi:hypothetical protein
MWAWQHNDRERQWELRYGEHVGAFITDEFIERVDSPERHAVRLFNKIGSVPPPLAALLPPAPDPFPVVYAEGKGS